MAAWAVAARASKVRIVRLSRTIFMKQALLMALLHYMKGQKMTCLMSLEWAEAESLCRGVCGKKRSFPHTFPDTLMLY